MKHAIVALALAAPLLAACVEPLPAPVDPGPDACGASQFQYLVGKPGVLLDGMRFSQEVRVIQHGMAVTMDYRADRLNFWLDRRDVIERVVCG
ncbi:MAG: I78 family peptidase inhibitor [Tabrizicola sp.]